jgi:signal transduction histidine kinase
MLRLIAEGARAMVGSELAAVVIADRDGESFVVRAADGRRAAAIRDVRIAASGTLVGGVVASGRSSVLADGPREPTLAGPTEDAVGAGPALIVPLASGDRKLGALALANQRGGEPFSNSDLQLVELFAAQAAVAIDYIRVRDELQRLAVLEDRERIGRELHDGAIQALFAVGMGLQGVAVMAADAHLRERLESSVTQIDEVIRDLRNYIFGLRPGLTADRHLREALHELAAQLEDQHGVACAVDVDTEVAARLAGRAADLVQLAREALSNVGRHASATTCRLALRRNGSVAVLEIEDDGRGFAVGQARSTGWGLHNLEERARTLGGVLELASVPGEGTTVRLTIPL